MKIAVRADASTELGNGHVMRCLTLADELAKSGASVQFICREYTGHLASLIKQRGYTVSLLPAVDNYGMIAGSRVDQWMGVGWQQDAEQSICALGGDIDWIIVDHYGLDSNWHKQLRKHSRHIMVIDDLADRTLDCDLLLDQTPGRSAISYTSLCVSEHVTFLLGSQYALLREQFVAKRLQRLSQNKPLSDGIENILISLGGTDPANLSLRLLELLDSCAYSGNVSLVLSSQAPHLEIVKQYVAQRSAVQLSCDVTDMAALISNADLVVGAAGTSNCERCCLGAPAIILVLADNQNHVAAAMTKKNAAVVIDPGNDNWRVLFREALERLDEKAEREQLASRAMRICDGIGVRLVSQHLVRTYAQDGAAVTLRRVEAEDTRVMFEWQCCAKMRRYSRDVEPPEWNSHKEWLQHKLRDPGCFFFIIETQGRASGLVRLDWQHELQFEVSILVDPACSRRGLGRLALALLGKVVPEVDIYAHVKTENLASQRLFHCSGYQRIDEESFLHRASKSSI